MRRAHGIAILALAAGALFGCSRTASTTLQGYAEGEFVLVASPYAGVLESLLVSRGEQVTAGAPLFALESERETAAEREAEGRLRAAQARLDDLGKSLRSPEVDALRAEAAEAAAAQTLSRTRLERARALFDRGLVSKEELDAATTQNDLDAAHVKQVQARLELAEESVGRRGQLAGAHADVEAAQAVLEQAAWGVAQKARRAPVDGLVHDTYFVPGEWVPAGRPVASLLPPGNVKLRFFVPEPLVGQLQLGRIVHVSCDGCGAPFDATIRYVAPQAEFTPPVIYSKDQRAKLVFRVEARPAQPADALRLKPGQPVDVRL